MITSNKNTQNVVRVPIENVLSLIKSYVNSQVIEKLKTSIPDKAVWMIEKNEDETVAAISFTWDEKV